MNLDDIQGAIAAYADEDATVANIDSDDYALRTSYVNQAIREWKMAKDWQVLYKEYNVLVSTATGNASIALPSDFEKPASFPKITWDGTSTEEFKETVPQSAGQYTDAAKRVAYFGNKKDGFVMRVYGATLASGASVMVPYFKSATSLASPSDVSEIPDPQYLVKRTLAYMLEAREDPRYIGMKQEAQSVLLNMIDRDDVLSVSNDENKVKTAEQVKGGGYRIGGW